MLVTPVTVFYMHLMMWYRCVSEVGQKYHNPNPLHQYAAWASKKPAPALLLYTIVKI